MAPGGFYVDAEQIHPNILIYRRAGGKRGRYSYRLTVDHNYITKSARTTDRDEAAAIAQRAYREARQRVERGLPVRSITFGSATEQFLVAEVQGFHLEKRRKYEQIIGKHLLPYFGTKDVCEIKTSDVRAYTRARRASHVASQSMPRRITPGSDEAETWKPRALSASTLNSEYAVLRAIFRFAEEHCGISRSDWPVIQNQSLSDQEPRPGFTASEFETLVRAAYRRFRESRQVAVKRYLAGGGEEPDDGSHLVPEQWRGDRHAWYRFLLCQFVILLGSTGMRPRTLLGLTWAHVEWRDPPPPSEEASGAAGKRAPPPRGFYVLHGSTRKGGKLRRVGVVPTQMAQHAIMMLRDVAGSHPSPNARLFPTKDFKKSFSGLIEETGLQKDANGQSRTIYSLRHFYITYMLEQGVPTAIVSRNTLTSEATINKYYNHIEPSMVNQQLSVDGMHNLFSWK